MRERITAALAEAMTAKDQTRLCTLRLISAAIKDRDIAARDADDSAVGVSDQEVLRILAQMIRQREDSVRAYEEAGRLELAEREREEIKVIREFLPRPLDDDEVRRAITAAISETKARSIRDMGAVMGALKAKYAGRMDFCKVGAKVRASLA